MPNCWKSYKYFIILYKITQHFPLFLPLPPTSLRIIIIKNQKKYFHFNQIFSIYNPVQDNENKIKKIIRMFFRLLSSWILKILPLLPPCRVSPFQKYRPRLWQILFRFRLLHERQIEKGQRLQPVRWMLSLEKLLKVS